MIPFISLLQKFGVSGKQRRANVGRSLLR